MLCSRTDGKIQTGKCVVLGVGTGTITVAGLAASLGQREMRSPDVYRRGNATEPQYPIRKPK